MLWSWLPVLPTVIAMSFMWVWTTYFWLRLARIPAHLALAASAAVTTLVVFVLSMTYETLGIFWSGARVLPVMAVIGALGAFLWFNTFRGKHSNVSAFRQTNTAEDASKYRASALGIAAASLVGWVLAALPTMLVAPPNNPVQQWDPSFHLNGVWGINQLGIAAPGQGLAHNYAGTPSSGYPIGWHAFTSLFSTPTTVVEVANASSLALMLVWVVSAGAFVAVLYPNAVAVISASVIAGLLPSMPADALTMYSQWPNAMSVALLPGVAALAVVTGRAALQLLRVSKPASPRLSLGDPTWGSTVAALSFLVAGSLGGILAHPVFAFNLLVLLLPALIAGMAATFMNAVRGRRLWIIAGVLGLVVSIVASVVIVLLTPEVESMRNYPRKGIDISTAISQAISPTPPFPNTIGLALFSLVMTTLIVLGVLRIVLARYGQRPWTKWPGEPKPLLWPVWTYLFFATLVFFAYGPNWAVRKWIVGPWFSDGRRIMEPQSLAIVPLAAIGFGWLVMWVVRWWNMSFEKGAAHQSALVGITLGVALIGGTVGGAMDARIGAAKYVLDPANLGKPGMATQGVIDMMRQLPDLIPEDSVVLGDPQAGAMYAQVIGQRWAHFPQLSFVSKDDNEEEVLVKRFKFINEDPEVCEVVREAGITHYFSNADGEYYGRARSNRAPGLYNVDTSVGFELVAEGDQARLYRITACD